jgi:hypothetical protein
MKSRPSLFINWMEVNPCWSGPMFQDLLLTKRRGPWQEATTVQPTHSF